MGSEIEIHLPEILNVSTVNADVFGRLRSEGGSAFGPSLAHRIVDYRDSLPDKKCNSLAGLHSAHLFTQESLEQTLDTWRQLARPFGAERAARIARGVAVSDAEQIAIKGDDEGRLFEERSQWVADLQQVKGCGMAIQVSTAGA